MFKEKVERRHVSLERAFDSTYGVRNIDDTLSEIKEEGVAFLKVRANTSSGVLNALAVMKESYLQHLFNEYLKKLPGLTGSEMRRKNRFFFSQLADSSHPDVQGTTIIPKKMREYSGISSNGSVYVVERNGYVVISKNEAIGELESLSFDAQPQPFGQQG